MFFLFLEFLINISVLEKVLFSYCYWNLAIGSSPKKLQLTPSSMFESTSAS